MGNNVLQCKDLYFAKDNPLYHCHSESGRPDSLVKDKVKVLKRGRHRQRSTFLGAKSGRDILVGLAVRAMPWQNP